jgi:hypothetical protein
MATSGARGILMKTAHGVSWMASMQSTRRSCGRRLGERGGAQGERETPRREDVLRKAEEVVSADGSLMMGFPGICTPPVRRSADG